MGDRQAPSAATGRDEMSGTVQEGHRVGAAGHGEDNRVVIGDRARGRASGERIGQAIEG
jgi:hypothetical protein